MSCSKVKFTFTLLVFQKDLLPLCHSQMIDSSVVLFEQWLLPVNSLDHFLVDIKVTVTGMVTRRMGWCPRYSLAG
jgi:hypothetical protein